LTAQPNTERPRFGVFATVGGVEYPANSYPKDGRVTLVVRRPENPDPALFGWTAEYDAWTATLPSSECERLVEVTSLAEHLGHTCQVVSITEDGTVGLYYVGEEKAAVVRAGFVQVEGGTWAKTVNLYDIYRYRERHTDLLFDEWKTKAPPGSPSAR
jgi:hypothetical protein